MRIIGKAVSSLKVSLVLHSSLTVASFGLTSLGTWRSTVGLGFELADQ